MFEKIKFGFTSDGVTSDFHKATYTAQMMVWKLGMGTEDFIGNFAMPIQNFDENLSHLSNSTKEALNRQVKELLNNCYDEVSSFLKKESLLLDQLSKKLLEKEELEYNEIDSICRQYGITKERYIEKEGLLQNFRDILGGPGYNNNPTDKTIP